jgi:hypothetical protein
MHITPADATSAVAAVAFLSIANNWALTRRAEKVAGGDQLWLQRKDIYVDLLAWAIRQRELAKVTPEEWLKRTSDLAPGSPDELILLEARVEAFASDVVNAKVDEVQKPWNMLRVAWGDLEAIESSAAVPELVRAQFDTPLGQPEQRMVEYGGQVEQWAKELTTLVRQELRAGRPTRKP